MVGNGSQVNYEGNSGSMASNGIRVHYVYTLGVLAIVNQDLDDFLEEVEKLEYPMTMSRAKFIKKILNKLTYDSLESEEAEIRKEIKASKEIEAVNVGEVAEVGGTL